MIETKAAAANERVVNVVDQVTMIDLEQIEVLIYSRDYPKAFPLVVDALFKLRRVTYFEGHGNTEGPIMACYHRLAAALTSMFADPKFLMAELGFHLLCRQHEALDMLFGASAFDGTAHLAPHFASVPGERNPDKLLFDKPANVVKFAATWTTGSPIDFEWEKVANSSQASKWLFFPWYTAMLGQHVVLSPQAHQRREELLGAWKTFEGIALPELATPQISDAFMYCSYGVRRDKHAFKGMVARTLAGMVPLPTALPPRPQRVRPRILVMLEWSLSMHAMHRVYGPAIAQLRERFEVIGMQFMLDKELDPPMRALFDQVMRATAGNDLKALRTNVEQVIELAPEVIYYPSIGMTQHSVALSALRLAPLQVMSYGHPATAGSPAIDFGLSEEFPVHADLHVERLCMLPEGSLRFVERQEPLPPKIERPLKTMADPCVIGIPAMVMKLNPAFFESLGNIAERAQRPIEYRFFPNVNWLAFYYTAREIRRWFPTAKTYPRLFHDAYMHHLGECDFALSTFPFGGTNSLTDAFFLGLPVVAKNGEELHEWWDGHMLRRVGLGQLVAETAVQYEETALELINNPSRLLEQQQLIGDRDKVWRAFFGEPDGVARGAFGRAIAYLWEHRDALRDRAHDYPVNWREFT